MKIQDERVEQANNKIFAELCRIIVIFAAVSFFIKSLYYNMDIAQCFTEYAILMGAPIYQGIRSHQLGVVLGASSNKEINRKGAIVAAIVGVIVFLTTWYVTGKETLSFGLAGIWLVMFIVIFSAIRLLFQRMERRREEALEKEYED